MDWAIMGPPLNLVSPVAQNRSSDSYRLNFYNPCKAIRINAARLITKTKLNLCPILQQSRISDKDILIKLKNCSSIHA